MEVFDFLFGSINPSCNVFNNHAKKSVESSLFPKLNRFLLAIEHSVQNSCGPTQFFKLFGFQIRRIKLPNV